MEEEYDYDTNVGMISRIWGNYLLLLRSCRRVHRALRIEYRNRMIIIINHDADQACSRRLMLECRLKMVRFEGKTVS